MVTQFYNSWLVIFFLLQHCILQSSFQEPITLEFQKTYAGIVLELEKLNKDLNDYLNGVQTYCLDVSWLK